MTIAVKLLLTVALIFSIAIPFGAFAAGEKTKGRYKTASQRIDLKIIKSPYCSINSLRLAPSKQGLP